ncbi:17568_t:CDS:2, partial [Cetraspora pellucida]
MTDNATNMVKAINLMEYVERIFFAVHTLQLAIGKGLKPDEVLVKRAKRLINFLAISKQNEQLQQAQELLKISKEQIDDNEQKFLCVIFDIPTLTMNADTNYNIRKDAIYLKSLMITEEEYNYSTLSFMWPAITTLTRNCKPISANIDEEIDLISILTIFDEEEEEDIVDLDEELEIITTADRNKIKLSQQL